MNPNAHQRQMHAMMNKLNALYIKVDEMHKEIRVRDGILQADEEIHSTIYACTTLKEYSDKQQVMKLVRVPNEQEEKQEVLWDFVCIADGIKFEHLQPYDPTKDPSAADLDDDEAEEEAEYHAHNDGPLEGREESVNDHNINAFLQIPIAQPTGNDEHLQRVIDAVKTVQSYVEIVQKTLHPIHPDPTRNSPVAQNAQFMNEVMSESDEDEDDDGDDRMSQDANELKEDAIPFTNSRGTFSDRPFAGLCVPEMIAIIQKSGAAHLRDLKRKRDADFKRFIDHYKSIREKLANFVWTDGNVYDHPLYVLFNFTDLEIEQSYFKLLIEIIDELEANQEKFVKAEAQYENRKAYLKAKKIFAQFEERLYERVLYVVSNELKSMKYIWTIQISYLTTECIVESVCSVMKAIYRDNRARMHGTTLKKHVMNVTMLPDNDEARTKIVHWVAMECLKRFGDGIIYNKHYLKQRREVKDIVRSIVLDRMYRGDGDGSVFKLMKYLLSADFE